MKHFIATLIIVLFLISGCKKFFDIKPSTTNVNPTTVKDFGEMLNSDSLTQGNFSMLDVMSDDALFTVNDAVSLVGYYSRAYRWEKNIWLQNDEDFMYSNLYKRIFQMNIILSRVDNAPLGDTSVTEINRHTIAAQALINRAWFYWQLANIYGGAYNAASSNSDLTVPLVYASNVNAFPSRETAAILYGSILGDLQKAISYADFPNIAQDIIHPGKLAGFAMLSRVYLYMGNYTMSEQYADSVLKYKKDLTDYTLTSYKAPTQLLDIKNNPEILMARFNVDQSLYSFIDKFLYISSGLNSLFNTNDMRFTKRFTNATSPRTYNPVNGNSFAFDYSLSIPEVMLNKAECLVRKGSYADAISTINTLRVKRVTGNGAVITNYTAANADSIVFAERRRELCYHGGMRWFDLKRLNKEAKYQRSIIHNDVNGNLISTLPPNSPNYLMQFSPVITNNNKNIVQNPRQ